LRKIIKDALPTEFQITVSLVSSFKDSKKPIVLYRLLPKQLTNTLSYIVLFYIFIKYYDIFSTKDIITKKIKI